MNGTVMPTQNLHMVGGLVAAIDPVHNSPGLKVTQGTWPLDIDADGTMPLGSTRRQVVCDLSEMLGYRLGKQIPMTANFRINYLKISLRNVDDANDNDGPNYFAGNWEWYSPTKHRVDAVQAWRQLEKRLEEDDADAEGLFVSSEDRYKGFRFGFASGSDVAHATLGAPSELTSGYNIVQMLDTYNAGLNNGVPPQTNAIFDRKVGRTSRLGWSAVCNNGEFIDQATDDDPVNTAFIRDGEWTAPHGHAIEVMGGLLVINFTHSSIDTVQSIDDDFQVFVDIGVSGWSSW